MSGIVPPFLVVDPQQVGKGFELPAEKAGFVNRATPLNEPFPDVLDSDLPSLHVHMDSDQVQIFPIPPAQCHLSAGAGQFIHQSVDARFHVSGSLNINLISITAPLEAAIRDYVPGR
jgi:hypothetical protein